MPPKKAKGRKGKEESSDDGEMLDPIAHLKGGNKGKASRSGDDDSVETESKTSSKAAGGAAKKGKKGKKGGKKGAESSDDGEALDPLAHLKQGGNKLGRKDDSDAEEDAPVAKPAKAAAKKGKKGKKGGKGGDSSDDGAALDPLAHLKKGGKLAALDSDDDMEADTPAVAQPAGKKKGKKAAPAAAVVAVPDSDEDDSESNSEEEQQARPSKPVKSSGKQKKKGASPPPPPDSSSSESEADDSEAERAAAAAAAAAAKSSKGKKSKSSSSSSKKAAIIADDSEEEAVSSKQSKGKKSKRSSAADDAAAADAGESPLPTATKASKKSKSKSSKAAAAAVNSDSDAEATVAAKGSSSKSSRDKKGEAAAAATAAAGDSDADSADEDAMDVVAEPVKSSKKSKAKQQKAAAAAAARAVVSESESEHSSDDDASDAPEPVKPAKSSSKSSKSSKSKSAAATAAATVDSDADSDTATAASSRSKKSAKFSKKKSSKPVISDYDASDNSDADVISASKAAAAEDSKKSKAKKSSKSSSSSSKRSSAAAANASDGSGDEQQQASDTEERKPTTTIATTAATKRSPSPKRFAAPPAAAAVSAADVLGLSSALSSMSLAPKASAKAAAVAAAAAAAPAAAAPVAAAPVVEAPPAAAADANGDEAAKPKKEKMTKLQKKLAEAAKAKAAADAAAGVTPTAASSTESASQTSSGPPPPPPPTDEEVAAAQQIKDDKKEKKLRERAMLDAMEDDEVEYYGSDHEERAKGKGESLEDALDRVVAETEARQGKKVTARQRKKLQSDVEAQQRDAASERAEEAAHREGAQFACSQSAVSDADQTWQNALDITIAAFSISAMDKTLFKDSPLQIVHGRKYGLVGPNGAGKSTLLKMIAAKELRIPPRIDCLYVEQEVVADETPAVQAVMKADVERWTLLQEERKLDKALRANPEDEQLNIRLGTVHEQLAALGADVAESKARRILHGLGFDEDMQVKPTKHFSGGWRMRISLARALFMEPTLLMLDEPTNHLDLNAVIWLDDYLQRWKKTLLVVSHDQDFLNSVCEEILHLEDQKVQQYKGNYDQFKEMEAQRRAAAEKEWEKQQKRLAQLKRSGTSKGKAEDVIKKSKTREPGAGKKKRNDAIAAGQTANDEVTLAKRPREYVVTMHFPPAGKLTPPIIEVKHVTFRYAPTAPVIFSDADFGIDMDSRVCIVGPNGAGKTTLLKLLTGDLEPSEGEVRRNARLRAGVYNQHFVDRLPMDIDPVAYLRSKFPETTDYQSARNLLGKFGLEGHAHTIKMRDLSGGQKARVVFCDLQLLAPHILFLDEPTNNLDIESIDALCTAINEFDGGVVVVTHDARLIESTDCRLWIVDEGSVTPWQGEFSSYKEHLLQQLEERMAQQEARRSVVIAPKTTA